MDHKPGSELLEMRSSRRDFLKTAFTASVFTVVGGRKLLGQITPVWTEKGASIMGAYKVELEQYPELAQRFGSVRLEVEGLQPFRTCVIEVPPPGQILNAVMLTRASEEPEFNAVLAQCTHNSCCINPFDPVQEWYFCSCHSSTFRIDGQIISGAIEGQASLPSFETTYNPDDNSVSIEIPGLETSVSNNTTGNDFLLQNYPNPLAAVTYIEYGLNIPAHVTLTIHSLFGKEMLRFVDAHQPAGVYKILCDCSSLPSGVYFYKVQTSTGFAQTKKLTISR